MSSSSVDLKELLNSWKLENILSHLIAENIDVEILKIIKPSHIKSLLYKFSLGTQIRFEHNLEKWRYKIGQPLKHHNDQDHFQIKRTSPKKIILTELKSEQTNGSKNDKVITKDSISSIDLKAILLQYPTDGPELLDIYRRKQTFSNPERKFLINLIVKHYLEHELDFNLHISYDLENAILSLFPNESLDMYRKSQQGVIYRKYLEAKAVYNKSEEKEIREDFKENSFNNSTIGDRRNENAENFRKKCISNGENKQSPNLLIDVDCFEKEGFVSDKPTEILLQTLYNGCKKFVKIFEPYLYKDFLLAAIRLFKITNSKDVYVVVNGCEISEEDFKNVILQYYKLPTFNIELKKKATPIHLTKTADFENSHSTVTNFLLQSNSTFTPSKSFDHNLSHNNSSVQLISNYLPDANDIRNIPALLHIVKISDDGKMLENKHRSAIAKAIIDECLNFQPERVLKRQDFYTLTHNLICVFPKEVESTYFIPSQHKEHARGKLWHAYNNKRRYLTSAGVLERRQTLNVKRKHQSDVESEKTNDKVYLADYSMESKEFSLNTALDWDTIKQKWSESHQERREELLKEILQPPDYMEKYSILKSNRGIELMEIDVNILHPTVVSINNWLLFYKRIVDRGRKLPKVETVTKVLASIDSSNDERYRASLALLIIPYIFPYNSRRNEINNEKAAIDDIQKRFIKEYETMESLQSDIEFADLQIRFVHSEQQINYAEFKICGHIFKCVDLLEALSTIFHYIVALNMEYPKMCLHIWQFIQLVIFQIEIQDCIQSTVESIFNDLCMS